MTITDRDFPGSFLWGTSMSAYQAEGNNVHSDYYHIEQEQMAWPPEERIFSEPSGRCADHYNRFEEDYRIMKELGLKAHRTTVEWARLFPEKGKYDSSEGDHYSRAVDSMLENGIRPFICLNHYTIPWWLYREGGFENPDFKKYFLEFVEKLLDIFSDRVRDWVTLNEPGPLALGAYLVKDKPPYKSDFFAFRRVCRLLMEIHADSNAMLKSFNADNSVGTAHAQYVVKPLRPWHPVDRLYSWAVDRLSNGSIIDFVRSGRFTFPIGMGERYCRGRHDVDFWGINYYRRSYGKGTTLLQAKPGEKVDDLGWGKYPPGIYENIVRSARETGKPMYIMENGIATDDDSWRIEYIRDHLREVSRAIDDGYDVRGYFHWSYIDNFEWNHGHGPKMGLVGYDPVTCERIVKRSARYLAEIIQSGKIP